MNIVEDHFGHHEPKTESSNIALDLIRGLEDRSYNRISRTSKASHGIYAEDELVRKRTYEEMHCDMPGQPRSTFLMVFSPDGTKVASTHGNHNIYITDIKSGKNIRTLVGHPRTPWCIAFHPTSNQILASGCLGGEVRIWDLSGGSEVWNVENHSVIASIAFHPNDRILVIATYNELHFWDWNESEPFVHITTANPKEKIRYVAFDRLGHKLITGIANCPQTRWERTRVPLRTQSRPISERFEQPFLRVASRSVANEMRAEPPITEERTSETVSYILERERRIASSYRNLVREYEQLVQRYLKVYKPPTMVDRGTDPMEQNSSITSSTQAPEVSTSAATSSATNATADSANETDMCTPSTSSYSQPSTFSSSLVMPSRILAMSKHSTEADNSTQTTESRKHKSSDGTAENVQNNKRSKNDESSSGSNTSTTSLSSLTSPNSSTSSHAEISTQTLSSRRILVINEGSEASSSTGSIATSNRKGKSGIRIMCPKLSKRKSRVPTVSAVGSVPTTTNSSETTNTSNEEPQPSTSRTSTEELFRNFRPIAEEVRNRCLPIIKSLPACDRPKLLRSFVSYKRMKLKQMSSVAKKMNRRPILATSSDSTSSEDENTAERSRLPNGRNPDNSSVPSSSNFVSDTSTNIFENVTPAASTSSNQSSTFISSDSFAVNQSLNCPPSTSTNQTLGGTAMSGVRSFVMELERLLMTVLLTEMEGSNNDQSNTNSNATNGSTSSTSSSSMSTAPQNEESARSSSIPVNVLLPQGGFIRPSVVSTSNSIFRRVIQLYGPDSSRSRNGEDQNQGRIQTSAFNRTLPRRRLYRVSAFTPTRVNYNRNSARHRRGSSMRAGVRFPSNVTYSLDELINYSARPDAEDNLPEDSQPPALPSPPLTPDNTTNLSTSYSNIIQDLETSLNDVRSIREDSRSNETSDMLSSFSESLENIMNQSDTILRNLGGSMSTLPTFASPVNSDSRAELLNDSGFFIRNHQEASTSAATAVGGRSVIETDHSYPRSGGEHLSPLMNSLHLTISYIQRQARLLRQQVESIERIDRTMFEVEQLQLIRLLIMEFLRYIRSLAGESRSTGLSSVRQMMAGTRISDSSPCNSHTEENQLEGATTGNTAPSTSTASSSAASEPSHSRPRNTGRKTYPPSRLFRSQRHHRRGLSINMFPRKYSGRPGIKTNGLCRTAASRQPQESSSNSLRQLNSYSSINSSSLNVMGRRLEYLLTEQTRLITRPQETSTPQTARNSTSVDVGERMLSLRLHDCVLRMNRLMGNSLENSRFRNSRSDRIVVTTDGEPRFGPRHFLSLIIDGMSRHVEELGGSNISQNIRTQIHSVLAMALLLSDLLLLQLVDSIPPPAGMNLDVERESLTSRIDQMCGQMLQNRFSGHSHQLTRSLQHMRVTMRHAYRAIGQTFNARRNAMLPNRQDSNRRQLLNRYLRNINRRRQSQNQANEASVASWGSLRDLILRYSDNTAQDDDDGLSNAELPQSRFEAGSSNNSDDNDEESEWYVGSNSRNTTNLYRTNNVNLIAANNNNDSNSNSGNNTYNSEEPTRRSWNVPSVQVNDVPISEQPLMFQHRILTQRRLAERVSELRSFPQMSLLRPRFLHPFYAAVNPFDADLEETQREPVYDCDSISQVAPNHRIQVWDFSSGNIPVISNPLKNIIVGECKIHNDASVDIAKDGTILVTLLPSSGYVSITNKLGVYSLKWETLGQCLYTTTFEQNAVSVSLSPLSRHLIVGLASRRVSMIPSERWVMARVFVIDQNTDGQDHLPCLREIGQDRDSRATSYKSVNCIRWLPTSGQGLIYATNTGQLVILS